MPLSTHTTLPLARSHRHPLIAVELSDRRLPARMRLGRLGAALLSRLVRQRGRLVLTATLVAGGYQKKR